jgi:hypothetical protein
MLLLFLYATNYIKFLYLNISGDVPIKKMSAHFALDQGLRAHNNITFHIYSLISNIR